MLLLGGGFSIGKGEYWKRGIGIKVCKVEEAG